MDLLKPKSQSCCNLQSFTGSDGKTEGKEKKGKDHQITLIGNSMMHTKKASSTASLHPSVLGTFAS